MKYAISIVFAAFAISHFYVLHMEKKASLKRRALRWWNVIFAAFVLVFFAATVEDLGLMIFVIPVLAWLVFASLKFTKFCERCGKTVWTDLPFSDKKHCPRCGSNHGVFR